MIRSEHVQDDLTALATKIKEGKVTIADVGTATITLGKLLLSIRSNQIAQMKSAGIELQKPKTAPVKAPEVK